MPQHLRVPENEATVLQKHVQYFDTDDDGVIWITDTYNGFRDLGFAIPFCAFCSPIIHFAFAWSTQVGTWKPDFLFRIYVAGIHQAKHGSDTGIYDTEGRFKSEAFDGMFLAYDGDGDGALTYDEIHKMRRGNRETLDIFGATTAWFEWMTIWLLLQKDGRVYKGDLRGIYDGSLMSKIREERKREKRDRNSWGFGYDGYARACYQSVLRGLRGTEHVLPEVKE